LRKFQPAERGHPASVKTELRLKVITSTYFYFRFVVIVKVFPASGPLNEVSPGWQAICHGTEQNHTV